MSILEDIEKNGKVPIFSDNGRKALFDYYIQKLKNGYYINKDAVITTVGPSRVIKLDDYKETKGTKSKYTQSDAEQRNFEVLIQNLQSWSLSEKIQFIKRNSRWADPKELDKLLQATENGIFDHTINATANGIYEKCAKLMNLEPTPLYKPNRDKWDKDFTTSKYVFRIYINTAPRDTLETQEFFNLFIKKCTERKINYEYKAAENHPPQVDSTILYCCYDNLESILEILEEIKNERPDIIESIGSPIATGLNYSYYALAHQGFLSTYNDYFDYISESAFYCACIENIKRNLKTGKTYSLTPEEKEAIMSFNIKDFQEKSVKNCTTTRKRPHSPLIQRFKKIIQKNIDKLSDPSFTIRLSGQMMHYISIFNSLAMRGDTKQMNDNWFLPLGKDWFPAIWQTLNADDVLECLPLLSLYDERVDSRQQLTELLIKHKVLDTNGNLAGTTCISGKPTPLPHRIKHNLFIEKFGNSELKNFLQSNNNSGII